MTSSEAIQILKAALAAMDAGKLDAARQLISKVIEGLQVRKHK